MYRPHTIQAAMMTPSREANEHFIGAILNMYKNYHDKQNLKHVISCMLTSFRTSALEQWNQLHFTQEQNALIREILNEEEFLHEQKEQLLKHDTFDITQKSQACGGEQEIDIYHQIALIIAAK
jgi:hypothetical protein